MESFKWTSRALLIAIAIIGIGAETFGAQRGPTPVRHRSEPESVTTARENLRMRLAEATANPQSPDAQYRLGRAYLDIVDGTYGPLGLADEQKAVNAFKEAVRLKPDFAEAYEGLGEAYGDLDEADTHVNHLREKVEAYKQAIRLKPDYVEAYLSLADVREDEDNYNEVVELYNQLLHIQPDNYDALINLASAYSHIGRREDAFNAYKEAILIKPEDPSAEFLFNLIVVMSKRYEEAIEFCKKVIEKHPRSSQAYTNLGRFNAGLNHYGDAVTAYKEAIRIKPDEAYSHYGLGICYLATGDRTGAQEEYRTLLTIEAEKNLRDNLKPYHPTHEIRWSEKLLKEIEK